MIRLLHSAHEVVAVNSSLWSRKEGVLMHKKHKNTRCTRYYKFSRVQKNKRKSPQKAANFLKAVVLGLAVKYSGDLIITVVHLLTGLIN
jgi:hypothetical protein